MIAGVDAKNSDSAHGMPIKITYDFVNVDSHYHCPSRTSGIKPRQKKKKRRYENNGQEAIEIAIKSESAMNLLGTA